MNRRNVFAIGGVVAVVAVAALIAFGTAGEPEDTTDTAFGDVTVTGATLPLLTEGGPDSAVGEDSPAVSGVDQEGNPVSFTPGGQPAVVIFLAHWCPHCQVEVPRIQEWIDETGGPEGVGLYAVATATDRFRPNYPPGAWLDREGWTPPVILDDQARTAGMTFGVSSFPFWVVVDADGKVERRFGGELDREGIEKLFAGLSGS